ncbi:hypothetical protein IJT10_00870 [bacterium]|nr:hypothetical protein [bacterium]
MRPIIYLIDTMYLVFKSYYALNKNNRLVSPDGTPTGALNGLAVILTSLRRHLSMEYCICAFESKERTFREDISPIYKANRPPLDEDLKVQIPLALELCRHLGYRVFNVSGFEADDVIASLAKRFLKNGWSVRIISKDKDLAQILALEGDVAIIMPDNKGQVNHSVDRSNCEEHYGVGAELIRDWLALQGDAADNIIGIKGIGPKTAAKLLKDCGCLEELMAHPDRAGQRFADIIASSSDTLQNNKRLTTLYGDIPLDSSFDDLAQLAIRPISDEGQAFFQRLGFNWQRFL